MERSVPEYSQSGLPSPYPSTYGDTQSEASSADHASAAQYPGNQEARGNSYPTSATPTSDYGAYPQSARSTSSFPEHSLRQYHPASNHSGSSGGMAQPPTSPSMPMQDGRNHQSQQVKSDSDVPIDPSIAAPSPTYAASQYSPYAPPPQEMSHNYPQSAGSLYAQPRPDWANYGHPGAPGQIPHPHQVYPHPPASAPPGRPAQYGTQQVYSFVPIPGAQQHKRPRRRYEEIERMYKCGWNGCEKAYGTLNHLNAHVTMQSHGQKRTPEEFKEIRKEWKARKKEEEQQRKAAEEAERQRHAQAAAAAAQAQNGGADPQGGDSGPAPSSYGTGRPQLPPIGYQPAQYPAPPSATVPQQPLPEYSPTNHIYSGYQQPASPYAPSNPQMYNQRE
ncbi:C2H2 finger domain transcription factor con7 [Parahypoxylon ruwenzoriense]